MLQNLFDRFYLPEAALAGAVWLASSPVLAVSAESPQAAFHRLLAFPGAEGFGALATGGRGSPIIHVTNLNDAGSGSFREAVGKARRMVVFDVGGIIKLTSNVSVSSDITLLGQTAPGDGICIYGHSISFSGSSNVIVRYLRFREGIGGDRGKCSVNLASGSDMIFDHVSIQWGRWDCLGVTQGSHAITFQNCIIGEGLDPQRFGALVDSVSEVTFSHNLWLNNQSRNPKAKGTVQYINNVVYNWGVTGLVGGHSQAEHQLDAIGNYFIRGPSSNDRALGMFTSTDKVFQQGNFMDLDRDGQLNGRPVIEADFSDSGGGPVFVSKPFLQPPVAVTVEPAEVAYRRIVADAGSSSRRDSVDRRLISELVSLGKAGQIVRNEADAGGLGELASGTLPLSSAGDGIPDNWKIAHGLDLKDPNVAQGDYNHDGYTNLEKYAADMLKAR